jgi:SAM-dependent methyltransferase
MNSPVELICERHQKTLVVSNECLVCDSGCCYPILNNIPRFVFVNNYASSFGLQWNTFRTTQLDSHTRLTISRDRLTRIAGGSLDIFTKKKTLEAGCGAGRFTELMLKAGASVFAVDLSSAVDANYQNCSKFDHYFVAQADIMNLPVEPQQFDIVVCIGVVQHTPNPEETMRVLCSHVKPGGILLMDHYTYGYPVTPIRRWIRSFLLRENEEFSMRFVKRLVRLLWPVHKYLYANRDNRNFQKYIQLFLYWSPVVDYHYDYGQLGDQLLYEWALLDTYDTLTDQYKHLRNADEIEAALGSLGMTKVETIYAGNGVEVRAWKPEK